VHDRVNFRATGHTSEDRASGRPIHPSCVRAVSENFRPARTAADLAALHLELTHDSQLRWLGPEKGVTHMAAGAVLNAA
jgi:hypothetical protein